MVGEDEASTLLLGGVGAPFEGTDEGIDEGCGSSTHGVEENDKRNRQRPAATKLGLFFPSLPTC